MVRAQPVVRGTQSCWTGAAMKQNEYIAVPQVMRAARPRTGRARPKEDVMKQLHHASRPQTRYRARPFNSGCHPFEAGRSAVRVRAKNAYLRTWGLSTDGSCSLPSGQPSVRAFQIIGSFNVRRLFSLLADLCAYVLTRASARTAEYFRQFLDPVVSARGIEIKGLGRRLIRDAHAEPDTIHALEKIHSPSIASSATIPEIARRAFSEARMDSHTFFYSASEP